MKCVIPGANIKILARAIHALGKIGEEMYVQPQETALSFRAVSMSNSAYCDFTFRDNYFSYYNFGNLEEEEASKCKISMRGAISVFKTPGIMDKLVETCHIKLEPNASKLIIILKYKNSVTKTFLLPILNCEALQAAYNKDGVPNHLIVQPKVLGDALQNFQQNLMEITLDVSEEKILMRNYVSENSGTANATRTQLALAVGEFDIYKIRQETCITFCMKELRAILAFADVVGMPLQLLFELAGRPIVFVLKNVSFEANLVLSTLNPEPPDAPDTSIQDRRQALKKRTALKRSAPKQLKTRSKRGNYKSTATTNTTITKHQNTSKSILDSLHSKSKNTRSRESTVKTTLQPTADSLIPLVRLTSINSMEVLLDPQSVNQDLPSTSSHIMPLRQTRTDLIAETPSSFGSTQCINIFSTGSNSSIFSSPTLRSKIHKIATNDSQDEGDEETVPNSPPRQPSKRARMIFKRCFQATFDPRMLPGHDDILARDTDSE